MNGRNNGNALFLILIAVALFAALSYAITQSGRGGGSIDKETAVLRASQVTQYAASVSTAVQRMILTGTAPTDVTFYADEDTSVITSGGHCTSHPEHCVFAPEGGGLTEDEQPDLSLGDYGNDGWYYYSIEDPAKGHYIKDLGTNTAVSGADAFVWNLFFSPALCEQINRGLGLGWPAAESGDGYENDGDDHYNVGTNVMTAYPGQAFACFLDHTHNPPDGEYAYYHALIEQ